MTGIFLNYRRGPQSVAVGALADRLAHYFGADQIFIDHQMTPGTPYPGELRERLRASDVVVAVIHDGWTTEFALPRTKDWVHIELLTALTTHKPVVPVLLEMVDPPQRHELPPDIAEVAVLQAARVRGASFRADVDKLVRLLEHHIAPDNDPPPAPSTAAKRKRVGRRVTAWATSLFFLSPILFFTAADYAWELFSFPAFASAVIMAIISTLTMTLIPIVKKLTYRSEVETGRLSLREATSRRWPLMALGILPLGYLLLNFGTGSDGRWQDWESLYVIAAILVGAYFVQRSWLRFSARDHTWPPPVNTEPATFRRAAHRLHEKLTSDPEWRGSRSLANQRMAVSVYTNLGGVRQELQARASMPLSGWIRAGHSAEITGYLGWAASIVALEVVAAVLLAMHGSIKPSAYLLTVVPAVAALVFTTAKTVTEFYSDRREVTRWIDELTEWQTRLKPLVFGR